MADEKLSLLFRRGTIDQILAGDRIVPGAVSFCTDEPGIYLDLTAAEGGGVAKRVRIGDFITVASFDDIKRIAANAAEPDKAFSENCLYYSIKENALMKYNKTTHQFVIINDLADVKASITTLGNRVTTNEGSIITLTADLKTESDRAKGAESNLSNRIDALVGGGDGDSIAKLRQELNAEKTAREDGDSALQSGFTALGGRVTTNETNIATLQTLVGSLPEGVSGSIVEYINTKVLEEKNRALGIEAGLRTDVDQNKANIATVTTGLTTETARATAAEQANAAAAASAQTKANEAAQAAADEATRAIAAENAIKASVTELSNTHTSDKNTLTQAITKLTGDLAETTSTANTAKTQSDTNKAGLAQEIKDREAGDAANKTLIDNLNTKLGEEVEKLKTSIGEASSSAGAVAADLAQEIKDRQAADTTNANAIAQVDTAVKNEATARAEADTALGTRIDTVSTGLSTTNGKVTLLETWQTAATKQIKDLEGAAKDNSDAIQAESEARQTAINNLTNALASETSAREKRDQELTNLISAEVTDRENAITEALTQAANTADQKDQALLNKINQEMAAANSMTFKGEMTGYNDLPATGNKAGDTYVVTTAFGNADTEPQRGDLLVVREDQADGTSFADANAKKDALIWVQTGYSTFNDPELVVEDAKIKMKSHLGEVLGTISVASASENITTSISGSGKDCTVNVNFVWGTF